MPSAHLAPRVLHDEGDLVLAPHGLRQPPLALLPLARVVHPVAVHREVALEQGAVLPLGRLLRVSVRVTEEVQP